MLAVAARDSPPLPSWPMMNAINAWERRAESGSVVSEVEEQIGVHLQRGNARATFDGGGRELAREVRQGGRQ